MEVIEYNFSTKIKSFFDRNSPVFPANISLLLCIFLSAVGISLGAIENSLAVQTNGLIAGVDVINAILIMSAVRQSIREPDYAFNYGYGKYESLAKLISSALLSAVGIYTLLEVIEDFGHPKVVGNYLVLIIFSASSFLIMTLFSKYVRARAKNSSVTLLEYDADLWKVDSYFELGVIFNLVIGAVLSYFDFSKYASYIDNVTAILLIAFALKVPLSHGKEALDQLLDRTLPEHIQFDILAVITEHINQICEFKTIHTRRSGRDFFVEIDLIMPYDYQLSQLHQLEESIQTKLKSKYPTAIVRLYFVPCKTDCVYLKSGTCPIKQSMSNIK